jgi:hypothetical protein
MTTAQNGNGGGGLYPMGNWVTVIRSEARVIAV